MSSNELLALAWGAVKLPASLAQLSLRVLKKEESLGTALQRLGWSSLERRRGPVLWFHVNGLGETSTALPVIYRCLQEYNEKVTILLTTPCMDVYKLLGDSLPQRVLVQLVPLSNPLTITAFLRKWQPQVGVFLDTPFHQELAVMARTSGVCLALLNAHMPGEDMLDWHIRRSSRNVLNRALGSYSLIVPRSDVDVGRFRIFGATLGQMPGWSSDLQQASELGACASRMLTQRCKIGRSLLKRLAKRQLWVVANSMPGEEEVVARIHCALRHRHKGLLTVMAPFGSPVGPGGADVTTTAESGTGAYSAAVQRLAAEKHLRVELLSSAVKNPDCLGSDVDILVLDDPEALNTFYALSEVVLVGGTLLPSVDAASSPAAAAVAGCAVLMGPYGGQYLPMASDLNQAAMVASEEAAAAVTQTGATMRGITHGSFDTPRESREQGYGGGYDGGAEAAPATHGGAGGVGHAPSDGDGPWGGVSPTWQQLVSEAQRPVLSSRPMSAPPTIPEQFHLRPGAQLPFASSFADPFDVASIHGDRLVLWQDSSQRSAGTSGTRAVAYSYGSATPPGSVYSATPPPLPSATATGAAGGTGRSRSSAINRFRWSATQEVVGFGYAWSTDGAEDSEEEGQDVAIADSRLEPDEEVDESGRSSNAVTGARPGGRATSAITEQATDATISGGIAFAEKIPRSAAPSSTAASSPARAPRRSQDANTFTAGTTPSSSPSPPASSAHSSPATGTISAPPPSPCSQPSKASTQCSSPQDSCVNLDCSRSELTSGYDLPPNGLVLRPGYAESESSGDDEFQDAVENDGHAATLVEDGHGAAAQEAVEGIVANGQTVATINVEAGQAQEDANKGGADAVQVEEDGTTSELRQDELELAWRRPPPTAALDCPSGPRKRILPLMATRKAQSPMTAGSTLPGVEESVAAPMPTTVVEPCTLNVSCTTLAVATFVRRRSSTTDGHGDVVIADAEDEAHLPVDRFAVARSTSHTAHMLLKRSSADESSRMAMRNALSLGRAHDIARNPLFEPLTITSSFGSALESLPEDAMAIFGEVLSPMSVSQRRRSRSGSDGGSSACSPLCRTNSGSGGAGGKMQYSIVGSLDELASGESDMSLAVMLTNEQQQQLFSYELTPLSPPYSATAASHEPSGSSFLASESPQLSRASLEHYLQFMRNQSMLSSPTRGRSSLGNAARMSGAADLTSSGIRAPDNSPASLNVLAILADEDGTATESSSGCGSQPPVDAKLLPPLLAPHDTASCASLVTSDAPAGGREPEPSSPTGTVTESTEESATETSAKLLKVDATLADSHHHSGTALAAQEPRLLHGDGLSLDFEFPEGSVPDDSAAGSPTLLVPSASGHHMISLAPVPAGGSSSIGGDGTELQSCGLGMDADPAATAAVTRSSVGSIGSLDSRSPGAGSARSALTQKHLRPMTYSSPAGSRASSASGSGVDGQTAFSKWPYGAGALAQTVGEQRCSGSGSSGGDSASKLLLVDGGEDVQPVRGSTSSHLSTSAQTSRSGSSRALGGKSGLYHVDSIGGWLEVNKSVMKSLLPQPSLELQRTQAKHDPLAWYSQLQEQDAAAAAAALKGVAPGLRAPMHSPITAPPEERTESISPHSLASVKTMLFPPAPDAVQPVAAPAASTPPRQGIVTFGAAVMPSDSAASAASGSSNVDFVTAAFTIGGSKSEAAVHQAALGVDLLRGGRPSTLSGLPLSANSSPIRQGSNSAPHHWFTTMEGAFAASAGSTDSSMDGGQPRRRTQDALTQLLESPRSPVSPVRTSRFLPPALDRRALANALLVARAAAAATLQDECSPPQPSPPQHLEQATTMCPPSPRVLRSSSAGNAVDEPALSPTASSPTAAWPLQVPLPSINTPRRELKRNQSAPARQKSPPASPLRHAPTANARSSQAAPQAAVEGKDGACGHLLSAQPMGARWSSLRSVLGGHGSMGVGTSGASASAAAVSDMSDMLGQESPPSSRSSSCPNTPTSRTANYASSPFRDPVGRLCSHISSTSGCSSTGITSKSFEDAFDAAAKAKPVPSPIRMAAASAAGSVYASPAQSAQVSPLRQPSSLTVGSAAIQFPMSLGSSSNNNAGGGVGVGALGAGASPFVGRSLFAEEEEEERAAAAAAAAGGSQTADEDMPLSPRASSCNVLFSPQPSKTYASVESGVATLMGRASLRSSQQLAAALGAVSARQEVNTTNQEPALSPRHKNAMTRSAFGEKANVKADWESDAEDSVPALPVRSASATTATSSLGRAHSSQLLSAPTFSRIPSLSEEDVYDASGMMLPLPLSQPDSASHMPRITLSGGTLTVPPVSTGQPWPKPPTAMISPRDSAAALRALDAASSNVNGRRQAQGTYSSRPANTGSTANGQSMSRDRYESPPRSPADRTTCPRSACPSASPVKPSLAMARSSPAPSPAAAEVSRDLLPYLPVFSSQGQDERRPPATPAPSARSSASGVPRSPSAAYISPCATDPRASPIKVPIHPHVPSMSPRMASPSARQLWPAASASTGGSVAGTCGVATAALTAEVPRSPRAGGAAGAFGFAGLAPVRTQPSSSGGQAAFDDQPPLLVSHNSAPVQPGLANRTLPPASRSSQQGSSRSAARNVVDSDDEDADGGRAAQARDPQARELHTKRTQQQHLWDLARAESRTVSAAGTPRSARALFSESNDTQQLSTFASPQSSWSPFALGGASPAHAPLSPRHGASPAGASAAHLFTLDAAVSPAAYAGRNDVDHDESESWKLQLARYMQSASSAMSTPRSARVLFPTDRSAPSGASNAAAATAAPSSPSWGQVSKELLSPKRRAPTGAAAGQPAAAASASAGGSTDPLDQVLSRMTGVQIASPVSPALPRQLAQPPTSPRPPMTSSGGATVPPASPRAHAAVPPPASAPQSRTNHAAAAVPLPMMPRLSSQPPAQSMVPPLSPRSRDRTPWQDATAPYPATAAATSYAPCSGTGDPSTNEVVSPSGLPLRRRLFRQSAPQLFYESECESSAMPGDMQANAQPRSPGLQSAASVPVPGTVPLPDMPAAAMQAALAAASLERQFEVAEADAADLPLETRALTPTAVLTTTAAAAMGAPLASSSTAAPGQRPNTAPSSHALRQAVAPLSPRAGAPGDSRSRRPSGVTYTAAGTSGVPAVSASQVGEANGRGNGGERVGSKPGSGAATARMAGTAAGSYAQQRQGAASHAVAVDLEGAGPSAAAGAVTGNKQALAAAAPSAPGMRQAFVASSTTATSGRPHRNARQGSYSGSSQAGSRPTTAAAAGTPQVGGLQGTPSTGAAQQHGHVRSRAAMAGGGPSPSGSIGGAPCYEQQQANVPPVARYAGQYLIPASQLPCGPRVGPAVWVVSHEDELVTALSTLLRDPLDRRSRGRAAAQGAAKLASSLVMTVWSVLEDMVITPALQKYIAANDAAVL